MTTLTTFANQSGQIPLSELDTNFATPITIGTTPIILGQTASTVTGLTLSGANLGTPTGNLANCTFPTLNQNTTGTASNVITNANLTGAVTSVGNASSLGSFTSLQLLTALTDETGTGANVFATSPTLASPTYTGTLTGSTGILNIGSGQVYKDASGNVGIGTSSPASLGRLAVTATAGTTNVADIYFANLNIVSNTTVGYPALGYNIVSGGAADTWNFLGPDNAAWIQYQGNRLKFYRNSNTPVAGTAITPAVSMIIDSSGNVTLQNNISVGGAAPATVGTGITFPAAQSASSDANTLDDYEEGTWVPVTSAGIVFVGTATKTGFYTKIGNVVKATFYLQGVTSVTIAAASTVSLPFITYAYDIGQSTNFGGTIDPVGLTTVYSTSTVQYITAMVASPNIVGTVTYTTTT